MSILKAKKYYDYYDIDKFLSKEFQEEFEKWRQERLEYSGCNGYLAFLDYEEFNQEFHDESEKDDLLLREKLYKRILKLGAKEEQGGGISIHIWW